MHPVLLLNQDYLPLNICRMPRALALVDRGRAEVIQYGGAPIATTTQLLQRPEVIRLVYRVKAPPQRPALTRRAIHDRDDHTCQYCGQRTAHPTLDHVVPRHRGGRTSWTNLVTACRACNHRKGGRTPDEANMPLRHRPVEPRPSVAYRLGRYVRDVRFQTWLQMAV